MSFNIGGVQVTHSAGYIYVLQRPSIRLLIISIFSPILSNSLLESNNFLKYCIRQPSRGGTSTLGTASLTFQAGATHGSRPVSLSIWIRFLPVVDLEHLATMLATMHTSGLTLLRRVFTKFIYLPRSWCFNV